jgi:hypothetical protein
MAASEGRAVYSVRSWADGTIGVIHDEPLEPKIHETMEAAS